MTKKEPSYRLILTLPKYHENLLSDINKSEGLSYAEILRLGLIDFHTKVQIKNNPNPFKVMHGAKFEEPQTLKECTQTLCRECAYGDPDSIKDYGDNWKTCHHRLVLKGVEEAEK